MVESSWTIIFSFGLTCWAIFGVYCLYLWIRHINLKKNHMRRKHKGCFNCNKCIDTYDGDPKYFKCKTAGKDYSLVAGEYTDYEYCRDVVGKINCWWVPKDVSGEF